MAADLPRISDYIRLTPQNSPDEHIHGLQTSEMVAVRWGKIEIYPLRCCGLCFLNSLFLRRFTIVILKVLQSIVELYSLSQSLLNIKL